MEFTVTTTEEQDKALTRSNAGLGKPFKTVAEFAVQACLDKINEHVAAWAVRDAGTLAARVQKKAVEMAKEDTAAIEAVLAKYDDAPVVVPPINDEPVEDVTP